MLARMAIHLVVTSKDEKSMRAVGAKVDSARETAAAHRPPRC